MAKGFSEQERDIIGAKLLQSCEECWQQYGYRKTTVDEICRRSGISTGGFYLFYPTKEHLFVDTAQQVTRRFVRMMDSNIPAKATKYDFAKALKLMVKKLEEMEWFVSVHGDLDLIARKLPPAFFEKEKITEIANFSVIIKAYGLTPKGAIDEVVAVMRTLTSMIHTRKFVGEGYEAASEFILDATIEKLFK